MHYLALTDFAQHVERVKIRADRGGHSAPESVLRVIYDDSLRNLPRAIREMDAIAVYDNGGQDTVPRVLLQAEGGHVVYIAGRHPEWLEQTLAEL
jgi:predicted ABC-type ATPase